MAVKPQTRLKQPENFLEAFRELGRDVVTEAKVQVQKVITQDLPETFGLASPSSGVLKPNQEISVAEKPAPKTDVLYNNHISRSTELDSTLIHRHEAEIREQIKSLQLEIRSLAKAAGDFANQVEIATIQATVNPGLYHKHFFERLRSTVALLRKRVMESRHWLAEFNGRSVKKNYYWNQVKKSGTSYMLSSERYAVTSTG